MFDDLRFVELDRRGLEIEDVLGLYTQSANRAHLTGCPLNRSELVDFMAANGNRVFGILDATDAVLATLAMTEPTDMEYIGTWFRFICVDEDLHAKGLGRRIIEHALEWAFTTPTPFGFDRHKVLLATIDDIEGSEIIKCLAVGLGFQRCGDTRREDGLPGGHVRVVNADGQWELREVSDYQLYGDQFDRLRRSGHYHTI